MKSKIVRIAALVAAGGCMTCQGQVVPKHRDLLVGLSSSASVASIYVVDSDSGEIRGLLSGTVPYPTFPLVSQGTGPSLSTAFIRLVTTRAGRIFSTSKAPDRPIVEINPLTGNRASLPLSIGGNVFGSVVLTQVDQRMVLLGTSTQTSSSSPQPDLLRVDVQIGSWTRIFGGLVGDGPVIANLTAAALSNRSVAYVSEFANTADTALYRVQLGSGQRDILSLLGKTPASRRTIAGGVYQPSSTLYGPGGYGEGPKGNTSAYPVGVFDERILSSVVSQPVPGTYVGGVVQIDPSTGDRTLRFGSALLNGTLVAAPPVPGMPAEIGTIDAISRSPSGELLLGEGFFPVRILAWNPATNKGRILTDFLTLFSRNVLLNTRIRSIAIYTNCPADVNLDGIADDADFSPFAVAYSIGVCEDPAMPLPCPSDLNADGMVDDADFAIFMTGYDRLLCE